MSLGHNHSHHHGGLTRAGGAGRALWWTILLNAVITVAQVVAGVITGSLALIADAGHNLSDVAALVLAYIGERSASAPATKYATFGHKRVEALTALISAASLVVIGGFIVREAIERFNSPQQLTNFPLFLTVGIIGLLANVGSVLIIRRQQGASLNMKAAMLHLTYDAASSLAVIVGGVIILYTDWYIIDPLLSIVIAILIVWSSVDVFKQGWRIFMEATPAGIDFDMVKDSIEKHHLVQNTHDLHIWSLSSTEVALSCHVAVLPENLNQADKILQELNQTLSHDFDIAHATIQIESELCHFPATICGHDQQD